MYTKLEKLILRAAEAVNLELHGTVIICNKTGPKPLINFVTTNPIKVICILPSDLNSHAN